MRPNNAWGVETDRITLPIKKTWVEAANRVEEALLELGRVGERFLGVEGAENMWCCGVEGECTGTSERSISCVRSCRFALGASERSD